MCSLEWNIWEQIWNTRPSYDCWTGNSRFEGNPQKSNKLTTAQPRAVFIHTCMHRPGIKGGCFGQRREMKWTKGRKIDVGVAKVSKRKRSKPKQSCPIQRRKKFYTKNRWVEKNNVKPIRLNSDRAKKKKKHKDEERRKKNAVQTCLTMPSKYTHQDQIPHINTFDKILLPLHLTFFSSSPLLSVG